jgi:hypothetical protein
MELFITVLTLLAAIYAVVPRERQLDLRLRIRTFDWVIFAFGSLVILYLEFFAFCEARGWVITSRQWPEGITPQNTIYLVLLGMTIILALRVKFAKLTPKNIFKFRELVLELYWSKSYAELFAIIQKHIQQLVRIQNDDFAFARIRRHLTPSVRFILKGFDFTSSVGNPKKVGAKQRAIEKAYRVLRLRPLSTVLLHVLPDHGREQNAAQELMRSVFFSARFLEALATTRPYLGLDIIQSTQSFEKNDFTELYIKQLLREPQSVLYLELQNNQQMTAPGRYVINESNSILSYFLSDASIARRLNVWKPVGDFMQDHLDEMARDHENDPYNRAHDEDEVWRSPLFAGVHFFDIMVKEALFQGIDWHMWLFYMPAVVKRIARNYRVCDPLADESVEFPIQYSFLLYEIFSRMREWILTMRAIPPGQTNVVLERSDTELENGNIPKSSIIALCDSAYSVLESPNLGQRVKKTLINMIFGVYFELRESHLDGYASVLLSALGRL